MLPFPEILSRVKLVTAAHLAEANGVDAGRLWHFINASPGNSVSEALDVIDELLQADTKQTQLDQPSKRQWLVELYDRLAKLERAEALTN